MDDAALVREFRERGDAASFARLVERHRDRAFRIAASVLGPGFRAEAEDITQDALVIAFQKISTLTEPDRFGPWLYRIAYRKAVDCRRTARHSRPHLSEAVLDTHPGSQTSALDELEQRHRRLRVEAGLDRLPDLYRTVLHLRYWMGCSVDEIAEQLNAPTGTIKSYLFRARKRLHYYLEAEGIGYE